RLPAESTDAVRLDMSAVWMAGRWKSFRKNYPARSGTKSGLPQPTTCCVQVGGTQAADNCFLAVLATNRVPCANVKIVQEPRWVVYSRRNFNEGREAKLEIGPTSKRK